MPEKKKEECCDEGRRPGDDVTDVIPNGIRHGRQTGQGNQAAAKQTNVHRAARFRGYRKGRHVGNNSGWSALLLCLDLPAPCTECAPQFQRLIAGVAIACL